MSKHIRTTMIAASLAAVVALAAACGGSSNNDKTPTPNTTATKPAATASAAPTRAVTPTAAATPTAEAAAPTEPPAPQPTAPGQLPPPPTEAPAPAATPTLAPPPPPPPPPPPTSQSVTVVAHNTTFQPTALTLPAGGQITLTLDNQDAGTAHDIVVYNPGGAELAQTDIAIGPVVSSVSFTLGDPGTYAYKCSVHPQQMNGRITAQ